MASQGHRLLYLTERRSAPNESILTNPATFRRRKKVVGVRLIPICRPNRASISRALRVEGSSKQSANVLSTGTPARFAISSSSKGSPRRSPAASKASPMNSLWRPCRSAQMAPSANARSTGDAPVRVLVQRKCDSGLTH